MENRKHPPQGGTCDLKKYSQEQVENWLQHATRIQIKQMYYCIALWQEVRELSKGQSANKTTAWKRKINKQNKNSEIKQEQNPTICCLQEAQLKYKET